MISKCNQLNQSCCCEPNILWSVIRIVGSLLIGAVCICGDQVSTLFTKESHLTLALIDNITHGLVGFFVALVIISYFHNQLANFEIVLSIVLAYVLSSIVDIDHFIEARSTLLEKATSLPHRPFLHNTTIIIILIICVIFFKRNKQSFLRKLPWLISLTAVLDHHTRDAVRRGYWLFPFGSTPVLPYPVYILISILIPNVYGLVKSQQKHKILNNNSFLV